MTTSDNTTPAVDAVGALQALIDYVEWNECEHEDTYRGGTIWTICRACGQKWADDDGGFIPYCEPAELTAAKEAMAVHHAQRVVDYLRAPTSTEVNAAPPAKAEVKVKALPRLTEAMMRAACKAHYGDDNIDGISMTAYDVDWSFRDAFRRMWGGIRSALVDDAGATWPKEDLGGGQWVDVDPASIARATPAPAAAPDVLVRYSIIFGCQHPEIICKPVRDPSGAWVQYAEAFSRITSDAATSASLLAELAKIDAACPRIRGMSIVDAIKAERDDATRLHREKIDEWQRAEAAEARVKVQATALYQFLECYDGIEDYALTEDVIAARKVAHAALAKPDGAPR